MQRGTRCLAKILLAWVIGLLNPPRLVSRCFDTWEMQSLARCLALIHLAFDMRSTVSSSHVALQPARELFLPRGLAYVQASAVRLASAVNGRLLFALY